MIKSYERSNINYIIISEIYPNFTIYDTSTFPVKNIDDAIQCISIFYPELEEYHIKETFLEYPETNIILK